MKRYVICSLAVMLFAGAANAQVDNLTLWLADKADGDSHLVIEGVSNTGVVQLWMEVPAFATDGSGNPFVLVNVDAILLAYDSAFGKDLDFEVSGFNDIVIPDSLLQRTTRGPIEGDLPHGFIDDYQYVGEDANFPLGGQSGLTGPRTVLLDELILHCIHAPSVDTVYFGFPPANPGGFEMLFQPLPPPGQWIISGLAVVDLLNGTFGNPFYVENIPEPATLSLLLLGGLAAFRRR